MRLPDLDWELGVFKGLRALWRALFPPPPAFDATRAAVLEPLTGRLALVGGLIAGQTVRILPAREQGGVRGRDILLPPHLELAPDPEANQGLYILLTAIAAEVCRTAPAPPIDERDRFLSSLLVFQEATRQICETLEAAPAAWEDACALILPDLQAHRGDVASDLILRALQGQLSPALAQASREQLPLPLPAIPLWGHLIHPIRAEDLGSPEASDEASPPPAAESTEVEAPPLEDLEIKLLDEENRELPVHVFEKVEQAEAYNGTARAPDGSDELNDHLEALQEVDLSTLFRGGEQARSVYQADLLLEAEIPDVGQVDSSEPFVLYDEWDVRRRRMRPGWCRVYPTSLPQGGSRWATEALRRHRRLIESLHRDLRVRQEALRAQPRQRDGEDLDLDAIVEARSALAAGRDPGERLYIRKQQAQRDLAVTLLLDLSASADSWVENRRVADVVLEAALILGEVADRMGDSLEILAFASHTRNRVRVWSVRARHEPWPKGRTRLSLLQPQGYTRIGPALRHATAELAATGARQRLLLLISDGRPTDYDRYEGRYGVADVRMAVREAAQHAIRVHALAVDRASRAWLPEMMGPGGWSILPHPAALPAALVGLYGHAR